MIQGVPRFVRKSQEAHSHVCQHGERCEARWTAGWEDSACKEYASRGMSYDRAAPLARGDGK